VLGWPWCWNIHLTPSHFLGRPTLASGACFLEVYLGWTRISNAGVRLAWFWPLDFGPFNRWTEGAIGGVWPALVLEYLGRVDKKFQCRGLYGEEACRLKGVRLVGCFPLSFPRSSLHCCIWELPPSPLSLSLSISMCQILWGIECHVWVMLRDWRSTSFPSSPSQAWC
jgi:hypothetical protein